MFTASVDEAKSLLEYGWKSEGVNFMGKTTGTPVYRLYNPHATHGTHMFTVSSSERDSLKQVGWTDEGTAFYV